MLNSYNRGGICIELRVILWLFILFAMEGKLFWGQYLIWMILLLGQLHGYKSCIEKERKALLELKNSMISRRVISVFDSVLPSWNNDTESDCCRWKGIKCNHTSGRVIGLFFEDMYFIESPLLNLSLLHPFEELRSLNLSLGYNGFFDDIEGTPDFSQHLVDRCDLYLITFFPTLLLRFSNAS